MGCSVIVIVTLRPSGADSFTDLSFSNCFAVSSDMGFPHAPFPTVTGFVRTVQLSRLPHPMPRQPRSLLTLGLEILPRRLVKVPLSILRHPRVTFVLDGQGTGGIIHEEVDGVHVSDSPYTGLTPCPFSPAAALVKSARVGTDPANRAVPFPLVGAGFIPYCMSCCCSRGSCTGTTNLPKSCNPYSEKNRLH